MFTSRAEYRLQLREDNADARLTETGRRLGLVDDERWTVFCRKRDAVSRETERLKSTWVSPRNLGKEDAEKVLGKNIEHEYSVFELLRRPEVSYSKLMTLPGVAPVEPLSIDVVEQVEIAAKYSGYIERQRDEVERHAMYENMPLPEDIDYMEIPALSIEVRQKLQQQRPATLGQASRISGVTPAAISLLRIYLKKTGLMAKKGAA